MAKSTDRSRNLAKELVALAMSLQDKKDFEVEWEPGEPASAKEIAAAEKLGLSDDYIALWSEMNGCKCSWQDVSEDAFEQSRGGFQFDKLADIVREDREGRVYFDSDPKDDLKRSFYPIEAYDPFGSGDSCGVVLNGKSPITIYYLSGEPELFPFKVDLAGYVDLIKQTRGYLYWQAAISAAINEDDTGKLEEITEDLERIFPDLKKNKIRVPK